MHAAPPFRKFLLSTPILLLLGCPPAQADDDATAEAVEPAPAPFALDWPQEAPPDATIAVEPSLLCPDGVDAEVVMARDDYRLGDAASAGVALEAYLAAGGEDPDGSIGLLLAAIRREGGDHAGAVPLLEAGALATGPLAGEAAMMLGDSLEILERPVDAAVAYRRVPVHSREFDSARVRLAKLVLESGDPEGALTALLPLLSDPAEVGSRWRPAGLVLLGQCYEARGQEGDLARAYDAYLQCWSTAPLDGTSTGAKAAMDRLADQVPVEHHPTVIDRFARAAAYHRAGHWNSTIKALEAIADELPADDARIACESAYYWGRSLHKRRAWSEAARRLSDALDLCADVDEELAVKATYIRAQGLARQGSTGQAIDVYLELPARFPEHSYADDGYFQAALLAMDAGEIGRGRDLYSRQLSELPDGDMFAESSWRLAFADYRAGATADALGRVQQLAANPPEDLRRRDYLRSLYWEAKMLGWPDGEGAVVDRPDDTPGPVPDLVAAAELFAVLAEEHPLSYYSALAHSRLAAIDPAGAAAIDAALVERRGLAAVLPDLPASWDVDRRFWAQPEREAAVALACAGLRDPAVAELSRAAQRADDWDWDTEQLIAVIAARAGDPNRSHNRMRMRFRQDHPEQLAPASVSALRLGYPLAFGDEVAGAVADKPTVPWLLMQGLVREESAFITRVVSYAGAIGLSQLMWPTAKGTAKKMGIQGLRKTDLDDPATNLAIGSTYLMWQRARFDGNVACSLAAYNAGPGAVDRWLKARGGYPLDEWVEEIPYKQTRNYVKSVLESYQHYEQLYGEGPAFVQLPLNVPDPGE